VEKTSIRAGPFFQLSSAKKCTKLVVRNIHVRVPKMHAKMLFDSNYVPAYQQNLGFTSRNMNNNRKSRKNKQIMNLVQYSSELYSNPNSEMHPMTTNFVSTLILEGSRQIKLSGIVKMIF
jgi:hypothetical protein